MENLEATLSGEEQLNVSLSNVLLVEGSGSNYEDLTNKPRINNVELIGNKSLEDLGIDIPSLDDYATTNYVDDALSNYATTNYVDNELENYASLQDVQEALNGYATESYVDNSLNDYTTKTYVDNNVDTLNNEIETNDTAYNTRFNNIENVIPSEATSSNQLADKDFVNSSIATNTANFRGTFNSLAELQAYSGTKTLNDYAFVIEIDSVGNTQYKRYKYNGTSWDYEYILNNSSFTAQQWSSINSGISDTLITKYNNYENLIDYKQDKITSSNKLDYSLLDNTPTIPTLPNNIVTGSANAYTIWNGTEAQYNAIATKDANTIYLITG